MKSLVNQPAVALKLDEECCSSCSICSSVCPFEAIKRDPETGKTILQIEKCQVCGMCYSTCPANIISTPYYDIDSLIEYLERARLEYESDTLVIMCKGSAPDFGGIKKLFGVSKFIPLFVPCVGRIPADIFLKAVTIGIRQIHVLACEEDFCRFDTGSAVASRKIQVLNLLLEQFGYGKAVINLKRHSLKVKADRDKCISCGNCVFYCPYHAVKLDSTGVASFDLDSCRGCGLCVALCPSIALELENWEGERISALISKLALEMEKPKVLVFRCQWAVLLPVNEEFSPNVRAIDLPCAARVDILHILEAYQNDIDRVMIVACPEEECKMETGSKEAQRLVTELKKRLSQLGLEDRLHFCFVAPRYPGTFTEELHQFMEGMETGYVKEGKQ